MVIDLSPIVEKSLNDQLQKLTPLHEGAIIIINEKRLPEKYKNDSLLTALDDSTLTLDNYFDEQGYIVASVDRLSELDKEIKEFVKRKTKDGRDVFEAMF